MFVSTLFCCRLYYFMVIQFMILPSPFLESSFLFSSTSTAISFLKSHNSAIIAFCWLFIVYVIAYVFCFPFVSRLQSSRFQGLVFFYHCSCILLTIALPLHPKSCIRLHG
ncbi:hypothetical protein EDC04DRAFT_1030258 [Pisolithus marmoratus]|nr:hypothetical protein EDC04DRAFT_1030258 [Pisolithus marmoratus]